MYLKSLEIQGFKSFPDKTVVRFGDDITAIVGPNGSGKSNISDAISWVFGEQSSKALRGGKMEDVIFGGTLKRAQVGFAEASIVLDNTDGSLPMETTEVMVTRRYYRSGESEYYINKQTARLRDINELFMDTGLGKEGYSNIGQGRIDEILSSKSGDRRQVFEEAAGISKFRHRKEETEKRLSNTQDNLVRIGDKITELELQVEPLRIQAKKATEFMALREELKISEVTVWLDSLNRLASIAKKAVEDYNSITFILEQEHETLTNLYEMSEQLNSQLHDMDVGIDDRKNEIFAEGELLRQFETRISLAESGISHNMENIQRIQQELEQQTSRRDSIGEQIENKEKRLLEIQKIGEDSNAQYETAERTNLGITEEFSSLDQKKNQIKSQQMIDSASVQSSKVELETLEQSTTQYQAHRQQILDGQSIADQELQVLKQEEVECTEALAQAREGVLGANNSIQGYELRMKTRQEKRDALKQSVDGETISLRTKQSRLKMFQDMQRDYDGYSKAIRLVMQESNKGRLQNIHGPLSTLIQVSDQYVIAIETALGAAMQHIVVGNESDGKTAIGFLKRRDGGRATFLPLSTIGSRVLKERGVEHTSGFVGVASDLLQFAQEYRCVVENLLGRTIIAENMDCAIAMAREFSSRFRIVTLDGQVMNAGGSMTGGSASKSAGLLSRFNEIQRLQEAEQIQIQKVQDLSTQFQEATRWAAEVEFELQTAQGQLREAEDAVLRREGRAKQFALLVEAATLRVKGEEKALYDLEHSAADTGSRMAYLQESIGVQTQQISQNQEILCAVQAQLEVLSANMEGLQREKMGLKMQIAAGDAERSTAEESILQLQDLAHMMYGDDNAKKSLITNYEATNAEVKLELETLFLEKLQQENRIAEKKEGLQTITKLRISIEEKKTKTEKEAQDKNKDILLMERESARLEQRKATSLMEEAQIIDKLWDSYELTPTTGEALALETTSIANLNREILALKRKISALGTPNLGAIEQYERINERYEYLGDQRQDVLHSMEELNNIVRTIATEMKEIFLREFGKINAFFGETFQQLFGGGKASLELDDVNEPLQCGIEIRVQPPGKQLKTITLLSGGEKAFVAIALYFSILKVRPTPFCLLDEIDAALDDNNVRRFAKHLRQFCNNTQFIIITHRRGTMEQADVLYGVTMQEQGISKMLHIDLDKMEEHLGLKTLIT